MDPTDEPFGSAPGEGRDSLPVAPRENEPDYALRPPPPISGLEKVLLVLTVLSAALVFLPLTAETALLHWTVIDAQHEFVAPLRKIGFWSCLTFMAASWLLEKQKEEGGHQAIIFGLLCGILLVATWAIETLAPFEGWWQALRLAPAVVYCGLAYAFLTKDYGGHGSDRPFDGMSPGPIDETQSLN
jgi:hypothetical protein